MSIPTFSLQRSEHQEHILFAYMNQEQSLRA